MTPIRIQRSRAKGWRMPENTVYVGRPSKWGNPFSVLREDDSWNVISSLKKDLAYSKHPIVVWECDSKDSAADRAVSLFWQALRLGDLRVGVYEAMEELRGKNLACWCPIGSPCHADALLKIANSEEL